MNTQIAPSSKDQKLRTNEFGEVANQVAVTADNNAGVARSTENRGRELIDLSQHLSSLVSNYEVDQKSL